MGDKQEGLTRLHQILLDHFNEVELRTLCFRLAVDYENISGMGKEDKARELVTFFNRHGNIAKLKSYIRKHRPHITWKEYIGIDNKISHNLPRRNYERFIGRKEKIKRIEDFLSPETRNFVVTIDGVGGVGKSTLALEVGHKYLNDSDKFSDWEKFEAIVWITAKDRVLTGDGILTRPNSNRTLENICYTIAVTLGREDLMRFASDEQEQTELIRQILTQQRTLLIIDNLETIDDDRIINFIQEVPDPTKVIVTTRHRIDVAYPIRLSGMEEAEALELIKVETNRKGVSLSVDESKYLIKRTGGIPLAIVWSIAQMSYGLGINTVFSKLGESTGDVAKFCFDSSLVKVKNDPAYNLLLALSFIVTDTSREILGAIADLPSLDRDEGLVKLEKLSLINRREKRFSMPLLARNYCQSELANNSKQDFWLRNRWIKIYQELLSILYEDKNNTVKDVKLEIENLIGIIDWCLEHDRHEDFLNFIIKIDYYLWAIGRWNTRYSYFEAGLEIGEILGDQLVQANFLRRMADIKDIGQNDLEEAYRLINLAIIIYESHNHDYGLILSYFRLSSVQARQGDFDSSWKTVDTAFSIAKKLDDKKMLAKLEGRSAQNNILLGDYETAKKHSKIGIELMQLLPFKDQETWSLAWLFRNLGRVELHEENYKLANRHFETSLGIARRIDNKQELGETISRIAEKHFALGEIDEAKDAIVEAIDIFEGVGMKRQLNRSLILLEKIGEKY